MMLQGIRPGTSHVITTENVSAGNQIDEREKRKCVCAACDAAHANDP